MAGRQFKIVGIGEVLYDHLPSKEKSPGGAPANFTYTVSQLGGRGLLASRVGRDEDGRRILETLAQSGVDVSFVQQDATHPTGAVKVAFDDGRPRYEIAENAAWDFLEFSQEWRTLAKECDAVCFGSLARRNPVSAKTIREFVGSTAPACLKIFDVNLRQNYFTKQVLSESLELADVLKLNHEELPQLARLLSIEKAAGDLSRLKKLREKFGLRLVCLTRGAEGSVLVTENEISDHRGTAAKVADTIGAGDAFTAGLVCGLLREWDLDKINDLAGRVGAFVASRRGAMPDFKEFEPTEFQE